ncbi:MAG: hypothetical protein R3F02_19830 [Thiolinea sp.]
MSKQALFHQMSLSERGEWEEYFDEQKQKVQQYSYQLAGKEAELNQAVYELFGLDAEEVMLLEQSLK